MKAFAELLLVVPEVWESTSWQTRTSQRRAPWHPPYDAPGRMSEEQAAKLKVFVAALQGPDNSLGKDRNKSGDKMTIEEHQDEIWMDLRFKDAKRCWIQWLSSHIKHWNWIQNIDTWAMSIGLGYDDLIRLSRSRMVGPTLPQSKFKCSALRLCLT